MYEGVGPEQALAETAKDYLLYTRVLDPVKLLWRLKRTDGTLIKEGRDP